MKTNLTFKADFSRSVRAALARLKRQMQHDYEQAYSSVREIIHLVLDEEETKAWGLSTFPHLIFPDLVEAHIATLNLSQSIRATQWSRSRASPSHSRFISRLSPNAIVQKD